VSAIDLASWGQFNVAMAGATAALAGLVIVAASVNIGRIVRTPTLTSRLGAAIGVLVLALVVSAVGLVPDVSPVAYGWAIVIATLGAAVFQLQATRRIVSDRSPTARARVLKLLLGYLPIGAYLAAGGMIAAGVGAGMLVAAVACLLAIASALVTSWVVLVEVLR